MAAEDSTVRELRRILGIIEPAPEAEVSEPTKPTGEELRKAFYRPKKQQVTLRLDGDLVAWLKHGGKGWQTRANQVLRDGMVTEMEESWKKRRR